MFKSILPPKHTPLDLYSKDSKFYGKENVIPDSASPKDVSIPINTNLGSCQTIKIQDPKEIEKLSTDKAFENLLDELQIPESLRPKLTSLDAPVKEAMLRSSYVLSPQQSVAAPTKRPKLRRSLSSNHIDFAAQALELPEPSNIPTTTLDDSAPLLPPRPLFLKEGTSRSFSPSSRSHSRGISMDTPQFTSHSLSANKHNNKPFKGTVKDISPLTMHTMLSETSTTQLDIELVKKLRLLLRNESASWTEGFMSNGGYTVLLTRLIEILEVEWREEQHDDKILHELLRCFRALSTSSIGRASLRSCSPTPFAQLIKLLYSDKKPGDISTRQQIIDLLLILFEVYPTFSAVPKKTTKRTHEFLESIQTPLHEMPLPSPHLTLFSFIRALLLTPAPPPAEVQSIPVSPHEFIASLHTPRIYQTYLKELLDVCRYYSWIFCHTENTIWNLDQTDERKVERPKAPGGMTGGVEFEAMTYLTSHFQLINSLARAAENQNLPPDNELSSRRLHEDLFASGLERIILTAFRASTAYYGVLHLEIARYVAIAKQSGYQLPRALVRHIGTPPSNLCLPGVVSRDRTPQGSPSKSRTQGAYMIPTPPRVAPLRLE